MSFGQFVHDYGPVIWGGVSTLLYALSEYLAHNPKIAANSAFQLVKTWLKGQSDQAPKA